MALLGSDEMAPNNARLGDLPIGAIFRSYRTAPTTWRVDKIAANTWGVERVYCHDLFQVARETDCSPAMSVWHVSGLHDAIRERR